MTRPTRAPGLYSAAWDGLDDAVAERRGAEERRPHEARAAEVLLDDGIVQPDLDGAAADDEDVVQRIAGAGDPVAFAGRHRLAQPRHPGDVLQRNGAK